MQTTLADFIKDSPEGRVADSILRSCVHCGFCTATCPTYQLLGDELDGPRGRIYLIKQALEGEPVSHKTRLHLDRCLTCRACETTCPSGVRYGRLVEIGRNAVEARAGRPFMERWARAVLRAVLSNPPLFTPLLRLGQMVRPLLPKTLRQSVPLRQRSRPWPPPRHPRRMLTLGGCVQPAIAPGISTAAARVLDRLGISLLQPRGTNCCGAVGFHLSGQDQALDLMRRNIDAWWPELEAGAQAVVVTASACTSMVKEYRELLSGDPGYAEKAARVSESTRDIAEVLQDEDLDALGLAAISKPRVAFHSPCTLQHAQKLGGVVESILTRLEFELTDVPNAHLCCGSAGTYALLQRRISQQLLANKTSALLSGGPDVIATANIGCHTHIQSSSSVAVRHWIELLDAES